MRPAFAARERHAARLAAAHRLRRAVEVVVVVPVARPIDAAALQPVLLDPVDQVLLVGVLAVVRDERAQTVGRLLLDPALVAQHEHGGGGAQLQQQQHGQENGVLRRSGAQLVSCVDTIATSSPHYRGQQTGVFAQRPNAAGQADNERDGAAADQYEGRIEGDAAGHARQIVEDVLFEPRPEADHQDAQAEQLRGAYGECLCVCVCVARRTAYPEQNVDAEDHILQTAADLAGVASVRLPDDVLRRRFVRHGAFAAALCECVYVCVCCVRMCAAV